MIHDRDSKFPAAFDAVFRAEGLEVIRTPVLAPNANARCERWTSSARRGCLDWLLIVSRRQLEAVLAEYVEHYNWFRPHRSLAAPAAGAHPTRGRCQWSSGPPHASVRADQRVLTADGCLTERTDGGRSSACQHLDPPSRASGGERCWLDHGRHC